MAGRHDRESNEVTRSSFRIYRDDQDIGGVDFWACRTCQYVLLGEIGLVEAEQNKGLGRRVLERLRNDLPGYRWYITLAKRGSETFWRRLRETHPGEYATGACPHIQASL
ncbi:MAG: hypothetical protein GEV10_28665 [Streptosporangiales bacterium]|nr:hypothetical protein [Streptosporangiales bacterium]